jgi:peptide deformylase
MATLPILCLGHPALRTVARGLSSDEIGAPAFQTLVDDMIETMRAAVGVGLAAPQVGVSVQLFVYEVAAVEPVPAEEMPVEAAPRTVGEGGTRRECVPLRVVINPMLTPQGGELVDDWEGCLSIPDLRGLVPRHPAVRVRGLDRLGRLLDYVAAGFEARVVQHEFDHLNGVVFLDRMRDLKALAYRDEWERFMNPEGEGSGSPAAPGPPDQSGQPSPPAAATPTSPTL